MTNSDSKKTIQINNEFFKIGKKGLNVASSNQTQKKERKPVNKTLKHNTSNSNINVIHGIIAENCSNKSLNNNDHIGAQIENNKDGQPVKCTSLYDIEPENGFNVIFADCEGCFDDFIKTYQHRLKQYPIDTIIYERDATDKINYENVDKFMKDNNFNCSGDFWRVCTH